MALPTATRRVPDERPPARGGARPASPLSVLHLTAPARVGGLERVVQALARGQAEAGHHVHVAAILSAEDAGHPFLRGLAAAGVPTHTIVAAGRDYLGERAAARELCLRLRPDVVHTHGYRPDVLDAGVARSLSIPVVTTVHGFTRGGWKNRLYEALQRRAFRRFDAVVVVSAPLEEELVASGVDRGRVRRVPNAWSGSGEPLGSEEARASLGIPPGVLHLGWVGRLSAEKGADVLVEALAHLRDLPVVVSMVGDGRELEPLRARAAALGVADRVRWHGLLDDAGRLFPAFDAYVLSSRTEGTPIALFEAMAAGVPVVSTRVGGVPDVVSEREALLVPSEDPVALAAAIREAVTSRDVAAARARAAGERLARAYGVGPWLERYEEIYRQVQRTNR